MILHIMFLKFAKTLALRALVCLAVCEAFFVTSDDLLC